MAPLCKFYQQGNCRNGANCRFEHPGANTNSNPFGAPSANRFNALNTTSARPQDGTNPYKITRDTIRVDLAEERPTWILSCYGPGKDAPEQLFGGYPREQSLDEVMLHIRGAANRQQAISEVMALHNQAEQQIQTTLGNLDGALQFVLAGANNHPNRIDICKQNTIDGGTTGVFAVKTGFADNPLASNPSTNQNPFSTTTLSNPFGGGATPAFGQPSTIGQMSNPFGAASGSRFGQPSQMGAAAPAFGQPSQMGASAPAFGQPSQMGASAPAFGQPSTMGQAKNPFGAPSVAAPSPFSNVGGSTFGQPSTLGQPANPFGAPAVSSTSPFGQPIPAPSGASPFARVSDTNQTSSTFGQPAASNPFAPTPVTTELTMDTSGPEPTPNNPFGQPVTSSGLSTQPNNPFGQPATTVPNVTANNPFSQGPSQNQPPQPNPFQVQPSQTPSSAAGRPDPYAPGSTKQHPPVEGYLTKAANGQVTAFKNQPVVYKWKVNDRYQDQAPENPSMDQQTPGFRKPDGTWCKILFPAGPPPYNKDTEPDAAQYDAKIKAAYDQMAASGRFQGNMPEVPPMREDCIWTF
ncbi:hypothetical protein GQX73_g4319 [Xylaria multiplex]|uniref:C3H1-type domain-containing protein n=1 Tax=Xylaria multiplex TaxID=323545 RepID=A0A7C8N639_9PEZI|nr:hypothetical protein GQX73_g4319 [Xylaria multiplex]